MKANKGFKSMITYQTTSCTSHVAIVKVFKFSTQSNAFMFIIHCSYIQNLYFWVKIKTNSNQLFYF